ncbi:MAG: TonB-dependent receptor plug domain-containing protein, partial [Bacteroidales bacterium]|nr:TonB-dependent receptor plug domain-containing protein [Bacteroidales bacterium]
MNRYLSHITILISLALLSNFGFSQDTLQVTGIVRGIHQAPVPGVSVSLEGVLAAPVITDSTGTFSISVSDPEIYILITPTGNYKSKRIYLNQRSSLDIVLSPADLRDGQDPATHIFYEQEIRDFASSASFPETEMLQKLPDQTTESFFKGIVPGMWTTGMSGMPGSGAVSYIRGIKSMNSNTQPLYVVDGMPLDLPNIMQSLLDGYSYNPLASLNPADITGVTVVKDYLNAPIFGMRGSNGIVFIETLKPTEVETMIDVSMKTGLTTSVDHLPQLNADQYRTYAKEVLMTSGFPEETFGDNYPGLYATSGDDHYQMYRHNTNWQNHVFRNALLYDLYIRILGGDEIARYGLSVGYLNNQGIVDQTSFDRFSVRFVGSFNMFQWLRFNVSSSLSNNVSSLKESARAIQTSPILAGLLKNPLMIPYRFDEEGNQLLALQDIEELGVSNPVAAIEGFEASNRNNRFLTNFRIEAELNRSIKFNSLIGINFNSLNEDIFMPNLGMEFYYNDEAYNAAKSLSNYFFAFSTDNYLNYSKLLGGAHALQLNTGVRINSNRFQSDWGIATNSHESD